MALIESILVIIVIVIIIVILYQTFFKINNMLVAGIVPANKQLVIDKGKLPDNISSNFTWSVWFYVNNWNTNYGSPKYIFYQAPQSINQSGGKFNFAVVLDPFENDLDIFLNTYAESLATPLQATTATTLQRSSAYGTEYRIEGYKINNIDLQKWVNLIITVDGRTLDIYLQGKLVRTYILPNTVPILPDNVYVGDPASYFDGNIANLQYLANSVNPQEAYKIYKDGISSGLAGDFFNKYRLKLQFMQYNTAVGDPLIL